MNSALRQGSANWLRLPNFTAVGEPSPMSTALGRVSEDQTGNTPVPRRQP
jgi:hypothetical protein